ncbi:hypothetical protein ADUPG1_000936 [Aduncisulcus paluster]|uniref:C2H2-type domain-containing protein n=1 Tax=Aduncisulcus paluster TaxID=2918883 RepID=A0ABQ5K8S8_9EUKA|nr:hypothetical protein ADUPG1_000936 [Aduncisulcus paluster]
MKNEIEKHFRIISEEIPIKIRCLTCDADLTGKKSLYSHILSQVHGTNVCLDDDKEQKELPMKRRFLRDLCVSKAMFSGIPIPALIKFLDEELQEEIAEWYLSTKRALKLCLSTSYDSAHRIGRTSLIKDRKEALQGQKHIGYPGPQS